MDETVTRDEALEPSSETGEESWLASSALPKETEAEESLDDRLEAEAEAGDAPEAESEDVSTDPEATVESAQVGAEDDETEEATETETEDAGTDPEATAEMGEVESADESEEVEKASGDVDEKTMEARANAEVVPAPRTGRRGKAAAILAAILGGAVILGLAGVAYATYQFNDEYDGRILPGVEIAGIDVGGMTPAKALDAVHDDVSKELDREISITWKGDTRTITPRELGARSNAEAAVQAAMAAGEDTSLLARARMSVFGDEFSYDDSVDVRYPAKPARRYIAALADKIERAPRDASMDYSTGWVKVKEGREGLALAQKRSSQNLIGALRSGKSTAPLAINERKPAVTAAEFDQILLVRHNDRKLYLYEDGKIAHEWTVAVGQPGYPTPIGEFEVELKRYLPTWINPAPDGWGASMPDMIPPGPGNPLGLRAINWTSPGIRFHGTENIASLGTAASHGCVRMANADVIQLYDMIDVGVPIVSIYG